MTPDRLEELLAAARDVEVMVVGDLMLDRYVTGRVDRVSPEAPVPVVRVDSASYALGGAGNVAANVTALGARCRVVGCVGPDAAGDAVESALLEMGVAVEGLIRTPERPTTEKTRILAGQHQIVRFDIESQEDIDADVALAVADAVRQWSQGAHSIAVEDYNKGVVVAEVVRAVQSVAEDRGLPWVVDPKRRGFFEFAGATVFKPNAKELQDALGDFIHPDDSDWMEAIRVRLGCENLLLTLGERGMSLRTSQQTSVSIPALARGVFDVSGAGDTVTAVTAVALAAGATVVEAARLANHAAAIEVGKRGVATVSPDELRAHVGRHVN